MEAVTEQEIISALTLDFSERLDFLNHEKKTLNFGVKHCRTVVVKITPTTIKQMATECGWLTCSQKRLAYPVS
jgi:hypothetical protein